MTLVLIVQDLVFEGPTPKTKDKWVPGWLYILHVLLQDEMMSSMTRRKQNSGSVSCGFKTTNVAEDPVNII